MLIDLNQVASLSKCFALALSKEALHISIAWDTDVKSMFFTKCLRSLVVRALERYFKDPGSSPGGDTCFSHQLKVASSWRTPLQVAPEEVLT